MSSKQSVTDMNDDTYQNGTHKKHHPCRVCGRYASEQHPTGDLVQPPRAFPAEEYPDGSTGQWTCRRCTRYGVYFAYVAMMLQKIFEPDGEGEERYGRRREGTAELF